MKPIFSPITLLLCCTLIPPLFGAEQTPAAPVTETITADPAALVDFAIPENPAAAILNSSIPTTKPTTPRDFAAGVSSLVGTNGKLQPGVSLAFAPYRLFVGQISRTAYNDGLLRFFSRMQISAATNSLSKTATGEANPGVLVGLGLNLVFIDGADPRGDPAVDAEFGRLFSAAPILPDDPTVDDTGVTLKAINTPASKAFHTYLGNYRKSHWNARSLGAGFAWRGNSATGSLNDTKDEGWAGWITYADKVPGSGLLKSGLFIANVQYRHGEELDVDGVADRRNTLKFSAQVRFGSANVNGYGEVFYRNFSSNLSGQRKNDWSVEAGMEYRVADGTWLNLSWVDDATGDGKSGVRTGLRYGFGSGPKWKLE